MNRYRQERVAAEIIQRNRELAAADSAYSLEKYGARGWPAGNVLLVDGVFQVYRQGDSNYLRYGRADCAAADVAARFFLHLTPRNWADLPAYRREQGFDNRDFAFAAVGGRFWQGECRVEIPLPDYPIAYLRTGQYAAGAGEVWAGGFAFGE